LEFLDYYQRQKLSVAVSRLKSINVGVSSDLACTQEESSLDWVTPRALWLDGVGISRPGGWLFSDGEVDLNMY
jgi:hypothetical protein